MTGRFAVAAMLLWLMAATVSRGAEKPKSKSQSPLDLYIEEATQGVPGAAGAAAAGSIWSDAARFYDVAADIRASRVHDMVTILVSERASAVASGQTQATRSSAVQSSIGALGGITRAAGPLANLANLSTESELDGSGSTSRQTVLTTTLTARVTHVLPNGYLVVEGTKNVIVNSENQLVRIRGVVRPVDLSTGNIVRSDLVGQMEVSVNGKGVVGDAVKRPFFLYRILLGFLPF